MDDAAYIGCVTRGLEESVVLVMSFSFLSSFWHRIYPELCRALFLFLFSDRACALADREAQMAARGVSVRGIAGYWLLRLSRETAKDFERVICIIMNDTYHRSWSSSLIVVKGQCGALVVVAGGKSLQHISPSSPRPLFRFYITILACFSSSVSYLRYLLRSQTDSK